MQYQLGLEFTFIIPSVKSLATGKKLGILLQHSPASMLCTSI